MMSSDDPRQDAEDDEGVVNSEVDVPEDAYDAPGVQEAELKSLTSGGEADILKELQRRCDRIIELEVRLDQERERANRLERQRNEDEALSSELRDLMANVESHTTGGAGSDSSTVPVPATESDDMLAGARENEDEMITDSMVGFPSGKRSDVEQPDERRPSYRGAGQLLSGSGLFADWGANRRERRRSPSEASTLKHRGDGREERAERSPPDSGEDTASLSDQQAGKFKSNGALRTRVVELELQRTEAQEELKLKTDQTLRLEIQVEQLKNVIHSLSHTSEEIIAQGWANEPLSGHVAPGGMDLSPMLRDVPGVDPAVMLLLHRTPWAESVSEGIRREDACLEWQAKDSRGRWSSHPSVLPLELSRLPQHLPQSDSPNRGRQAFPAGAGRASLSPPWSSDGIGRGSSPDGPQVEGEQAGRWLKGKIDAAFGAGGAWGGASTGADMVTDESVTIRFALSDVRLPSDDWEWVGGWMPEAEDDASADQDGWVYGGTPKQILERAGSGRDTEASATCLSVSAVAPASGGGGSRSSSSNSSSSSTAGVDSRVTDSSVKQTRDSRLAGEMAEDSTSGEVRGARFEVEATTGITEPRDDSPDTSDACGEWGLRRRRLVRLRMVTKIGGARENTKKFLETMRRMSSLEVLVRKLSRQVVSLHRQVTGLEGQVAFLAPLQPKLRHACALGRRDRQRGDVLQRRLIDAENELKVLRRCVGNTSAQRSPEASALDVGPARKTFACDGAPENTPSTHSPTVSGDRGQGPWAWVGGVAQRAAGTLGRRSAAEYPPKEFEVYGFVAESAGNIISGGV